MCDVTSQILENAAVLCSKMKTAERSFHFQKLLIFSAQESENPELTICNKWLENEINVGLKIGVHLLFYHRVDLLHPRNEPSLQTGFSCFDSTCFSRMSLAI